MTEIEQLKQIREKIDSIDQQLHELINQRAQYALKVAEIKQRSKSATLLSPRTRSSNTASN